MMQKILQKKANRNIIIFICMVLIALLCRILGKISFQYVLNGIVRSIIYIGLYIGWAISIHKRVVQKSVKNTLLLISGLMISWFIIRTIKYFFTIDANIERYLWYSYYLPIIGICISIIYAIIYASGVQWMQVIGGDITAVLCLMFVCIFESCIYCGLIQTNTGYEQLFEVCTMGAQITDLKYHVCYASSNAMELSKTIMKESAKKEVVVDKKTVIKSRLIQGGYVLWQEDIKDILMLLEKMEENRKTIEESNCIEQENYQTKAKINMLREKNRLYDKLQMQTAGQIELLNNLLYQYEAETNLTAKRRLLAKISVIGTYIKRCGNLIFIEERAEVSDIAELNACLEESFSSLRLMGVMCAFAAPSGAFIYVRDAVRIYNFFETVIEACLDSLLSVWVKFRVHKESLIFCMEVESNANLTSFFEITDTSSYEDGVWRFTFTVKKAGEA